MKKESTFKSPAYIIMNEDGEFFSGFMYGEFVWSKDINDAKELYDDGHKFNMMRMLWYKKEIIKDYI